MFIKNMISVSSCKNPVYSHSTVKMHQSFKGYDARKLEALVMTIEEPGLVKQMREIGHKNGFDVVYLKMREIYDSFSRVKSAFSRWSQDHAAILPDKKVLLSKTQPELGREVARMTDLGTIELSSTIPGGNFYIVKNGESQNLLIGANQVKCFGDKQAAQTIDSAAGKFEKEKLKEVFNSKEVTILPQMDYHLDLFVRPLKDNKILVCDDRLMLEGMEKMKSRIEELLCLKSTSKDDKEILCEIKKNLVREISNFKEQIVNNVNPKADIIVKRLKSAGYEPVRVPARHYETMPHTKKISRLESDLNYINAVVHERADGELVYITNKSSLDERMGILPEDAEKFGIGFENMFKEAISPYVKKENVHFVNIGDRLTTEEAGIHCFSMEVPKL